ncbi:hypothetical protein F0562_033161 [Nyssa sinensis]|uniref:65-kDa microtubule-associated protein 8 n=1 Tax=Nyssa sinensis TaxID=561372 RepID=A0A5J5ATZ0_9ASTE|nr:hypothetical protein F0562_033161 [Nyssa sinensis]
MLLVKELLSQGSLAFSLCSSHFEGSQMGSFQTPIGMRSSAMLETTCGYLLQELQIIWDEVGEDPFEREKVLLDLEHECLEVYRRKVDGANISRARLHQELADSEAEFTHLLLSLGERSLPGRPEKMVGTLKEQLDSITPALREMQLRKEERLKQVPSCARANSENFCRNKRLHNDKSERLQRVKKYISIVQNLSTTLGMDSSMIITKVHPSLNELSGMSKNISDSILAKLQSTVVSLEEEKKMRLEKLRHLGKALTNLWDLMDTPYVDRRLFSHVTSLLSISSAERSTHGSLTFDIIQQAEAEVKRLDQLKASKMKELFFKKQIELEEICNMSHMEIPSQSEMDNIINLINSGEIDHADLLMSTDEQILRAKEEASSRKVIMEKVEKWMLARDEERWLEEYSRDENRYSVSRALVDSLIAKTKLWEEERKKVFLYDEVSLLAMLEEYSMSRQEKEEEKQRQRVKKKVQSQVVAEQENLFGPRPSTSSRRLSDRSFNGGISNAAPLNRRLSSLGIQQLATNSIDSAIQGISFIKEGKKARRQKPFVLTGLDTASRLEHDVDKRRFRLQCLEGFLRLLCPYSILNCLEACWRSQCALNQSEIMRASVKRPPTPDADEEHDQEPTLQEIINIKVIIIPSS